MGRNARALKPSRTFRPAADGQSSGTGPMSSVPWKHTSPIDPFCALMMPHGEITW